MTTTGTEPTRQTHRAGLAFAAVTAAVSGVAVFTNGLALQRFDDATDYTTAKNLVAAVVLLAVAASTVGVSEARRSLARVPLWWTVAVAVGGSVPFVLFFEGLARADSTDAAFIHKTLVAWVALGAVALLGERLRTLNLVAIVAILVGQHQLVGGFGLDDPGSGEALITLATFIWAGEVLVTRRFVQQVQPAVVAATRMAGGAALLVVWALARNGGSGLADLGWNRLGWILLTGSILAAYVASWHRALRAAGAIDVTSVLVGGAIVTAMLDDLAGRSSIASAGTGLALVAAGTAVAAMAAARATPRTPAVLT